MVGSCPNDGLFWITPSLNRRNTVEVITFCNAKQTKLNPVMKVGEKKELVDESTMTTMSILNPMVVLGES